MNIDMNVYEPFSLNFSSEQSHVVVGDREKRGDKEAP